MTNNFRFPAEWEPQQAVIIAWPHADTDWAPMLDEIERCYVQMATVIARHVEKLIIVTLQPERVLELLDQNVDRNSIIFAKLPTNDTWTRDYGFISIEGIKDSKMRAADYMFNGWGLKFAADRDNLVNSGMVRQSMIDSNALYLNRMDFVLEGGSIESDGRGLMLTTSECLLSPNRNGNLTRFDIERRFERDFGCARLLWLDHGALAGDDTDSHIDTLARLAPGNIILYSSCDRPDDSHYAELRAMKDQISTLRTLEGEAFRLVDLPIPEAIYDENGERLPATYANFLILNHAVIIPIYGDSKYDRIAVEHVRTAFPGYTFETLDCRPLIRQHGSLHCATMQVPYGVLAL